VPQKDTIHEIVKQAVIKDGWSIAKTDDPYVISYGERFLFIDLAASKSNNISHIKSSFIGAERGNSRIAIEIKGFRGKSIMLDLEQAIGQYTLYRLLLNKVNPGREVYLAITDVTYDEFFSEPIGELIINELPLKLIIVNVEKAEIVQWIR
jgi:hypothetical protein